MPCLNEERTLPLCIEKAQRAFEQLGIRGEVVIGDNGSTDSSIRVAEAMGARVVRQPLRGYGAALQAAIEAARGRIIIMGDSDDSYDWSDIGAFVQMIQGGHDLVVGNRFRGGIEAGAMPPLHRYLGNPVFSLVSRVVFRVGVGDFHCGMRAFSREAYERMRPRTLGMEFATEMVASAAALGLRVGEIPIRLHKDKRDRPPHLRSFRDGWRHLKFIFSYAPDHLFLYPGAVLLFLGTLLQALLISGPFAFGRFFMGIHFLVLGGGAALMGFNVMAMGVLAKLIVGHRFPKTLGAGTKHFLRLFSIDRGLVAGAILFLLGFAGAFAILLHWLVNIGRDMSATVHPAFIAIHLMVLGLNVAFMTFLLGLALQEERGGFAE